MMRTRHLCAAGLTLLALSLAPARANAAQGIALAWDHCVSEGTGVQNRQFACDTNAGSHTMVGTFQLGSPLTQMNGAEIVLQIASQSASLPAWWEYFNAGTCRQTGLSANGVHDAGDLTCPDWSGGQQSVFLAGYCGSLGTCVDHPSNANEVRIKLVEAVTVQNVASIAAGQDYFSFNLVISNSKTVGTDACAGCATPVCIVLNSIKLTTVANVSNLFLSTVSAPGGNFVTWQGGGPGCPGATPTRNATWGSVKSLYR